MRIIQNEGILRIVDRPGQRHLRRLLKIEISPGYPAGYCLLDLGGSGEFAFYSNSIRIAVTDAGANLTVRAEPSTVRLVEWGVTTSR